MVKKGLDKHERKLMWNMFGNVSVLVDGHKWKPQREAWMYDATPTSGISGLSFDSTSLPPLLFFCLVLLLILSDLFLLAGPFS